jgi:hypothetical protein
VVLALVLVLGGGGRAGTGIVVHLLLSFFVGVMSANEAAGTGTENPVVSGEMTRRAANDCAFETPRSLCMTRQKCRREKQGCCTYDRLHQTNPSSILDSRRQTLLTEKRPTWASLLGSGRRQLRCSGEPDSVAALDGLFGPR